jgi:hypothetical protein
MVLFLLGMLHTGLILNDNNLQNLGGGRKGCKSSPSNGLAHVDGALAFTFLPGETYLCLTTKNVWLHIEYIQKYLKKN